MKYDCSNEHCNSPMAPGPIDGARGLKIKYALPATLSAVGETSTGACSKPRCIISSAYLFKAELQEQIEVPAYFDSPCRDDLRGAGVLLKPSSCHNRDVIRRMSRRAIRDANPTASNPSFV